MIIILINIYRWLLQDGSKEDAIHNAVEDIRSGKCSFRKAELKYRIRRSTLNDYTTGRVEIRKRQGPQPVLCKDKTINWAVEMNKIGYGQTRRQICEMVKNILDKDGRPNYPKPFKDNCAGKDWWYAFFGLQQSYYKEPFFP